MEYGGRPSGDNDSFAKIITYDAWLRGNPGLSNSGESDDCATGLLTKESTGTAAVRRFE